MIEREIQELLQYHPYLLDPEIFNVGRRERVVKAGRIDIDFFTQKGTIIVECKREELKEQDTRQLRGYIKSLLDTKEIVYKAYLVGMAPAKELSDEYLGANPKITVKTLIESIPLRLYYCRQGHYFSMGLNKCPYCGSIKSNTGHIYLDS